MKKREKPAMEDDHRMEEFLRLKNEIRRDERRGASLGKLWVLLYL